METHLQFWRIYNDKMLDDVGRQACNTASCWERSLHEENVSEKVQSNVIANDNVYPLNDADPSTILTDIMDCINKDNKHSEIKGKISLI